MDLIKKALEASGGLELSVLLLLLVFSIVSWAIILMKWKKIKELKTNSQNFQNAFDKALNFEGVVAVAPLTGASPLNSIFTSAVSTLQVAENDQLPTERPKALAITIKPPCKVEEKVVHSMQAASKAEFQKLNWGLGFLASVGSASPFIGLFGTVWGIMHTFQKLGEMKSASLDTVAPGISAALIATAAGLVVAIPAVMAYNWMLGQIDVLQEQADLFIERISILIKASGFTDSESKTLSVGKGD